MALVGLVFLDTSVLLAGLIEFGEASAAAQLVMDTVAARRLNRVGSAWHCCLEFYAVSTRLPPEFRLTPSQSTKLIKEEILDRLEVYDMPADAREGFFTDVESQRIAGGRIYDAHIAEIARLAGARTVVTDNRRHFTMLMRHGIRVLNPAEFVAELR